jgi:hypothetical protein
MKRPHSWQPPTDLEVGCLPVYSRGEIAAYAVVDEADWHEWKHKLFSFAAGGRYVATTISGRREYLHRLILGLPPGRHPVCDHRNRDILDNRRSNLRVVSQQENCANRGGKFARAA